jgi:threonine synthase
VPDWIVCPGGNLGNCSAFGKALYEMHQIGLIDRMPRLAVIQAEGANPLYQAYKRGFDRLEPVQADTVASAIKIGNPVNYPKAARAVKWTNGVVEQVSDQQIMEAKALIDGHGIGCEPASGCTLAGIRKLVASGIIQPHETVVGILTGHVLKDPDATIAYHRDQLQGIHPTHRNMLHEAEPTVESIRAVLDGEVVSPQA